MNAYIFINANCLTKGKINAHFFSLYLPVFKGLKLKLISKPKTFVRGDTFWSPSRRLVFTQLSELIQMPALSIHHPPCAHVSTLSHRVQQSPAHPTEQTACLEKDIAFLQLYSTFLILISQLSSFIYSFLDLFKK